MERAGNFTIWGPVYNRGGNLGGRPGDPSFSMDPDDLPTGMGGGMASSKLVRLIQAIAKALMPFYGGEGATTVAK